VNVAAIIGRLGKEPELRYTSEGKPICTVSVAVDKGRGKEPDWFTVVAWDKTAEAIAGYLHRGDKAGFSGAMHQRSYEAQSGDKRVVWELHAVRVDFFAPKRDDQATPTSDDDEPPF